MKEQETYFQDDFFGDHETHLREYLKTIWKRKNTVLIVFLLIFTGGLIGTLRMTPIYEASIQILVEKNQSTPLVGEEYSSPRDSEFFATQEQLIKSQNVARKVVQHLRLEENYGSYFPGWDKEKVSFIKNIVSGLKEWLKSFGASDETDSANVVLEKKQFPTDFIVSAIKKNINVEPVKKSRVINVSFRSKNPVFASLVVNTIALAYQEEVMDIQMHSSGYALQWMTQKANEEKDKLTKARMVLQNYMQQHDIVTLEGRVAIVPKRLSVVSEQFSRAQENRKTLESRYNQIKLLQKENRDLSTLPIIANNAGLQSLRQQVNEAEFHISDLKRKYGHKHPLMVKAQKNVDELKNKVQQEIEKIISLVKNQYENILTQEKNARFSLAEVKQDALLLNDKMTEYNLLQSDVDNISALYNALSLRIKEKDVSGKTLKVNVWTTEKAEVPTEPVKPNKKRNILLGALLGLIGGVLFTFFLEYLDNTLSDPEEIERRFQLPVLCVLEELEKENNLDTMLLEQSKSAFAESFKAMRTSLILSSTEKEPQIILVTSANPGEGKTTIALNLAVSYAQTDRKVLLVDTDLRKPRLHKAMMLNNDTGLSELLALDEKTNCIIKDEKTGIAVLTAGPTPPNPSELLGSKAFSRILEKARGYYDVIIIDSSPLFSATDSLLVSSLVDGIVLVTSASKTTYDAVGRCLQMLADIHANVLGVVLNNTKVKGNMEYYKSYGYYKQSYKEN